MEDEPEGEQPIALAKWIRSLYDWVAGFAESTHADVALFLIAFAESSFFPIPPDVLLIVLVFARPKRAFVYALICTAGSVLGGAFGYFLGHTVLRGTAVDAAAWLGLERHMARAGLLYDQYDVWAVGIAAFTVIPYKVFTILAGLFGLDFWRFMAASLAGRGGRFFLVSGVIYILGPRAKPFVERYLGWITLALAALVVIGFFALGLVGSGPQEIAPEEARDRIAALASSDLEARRQAIRYLRKRTGVFFGYNPAGPSEERREAIGKWQEWYEAEFPDDPPLEGSGAGPGGDG